LESAVETERLVALVEELLNQLVAFAAEWEGSTMQFGCGRA
jgi:hypothetical protein